MTSAKTEASSPGRSFVTIIAAISALSGLLFGYDTGVISGAILFVQEDFRLTTLQEENRCKRRSAGPP